MHYLEYTISYGVTLFSGHISLGALGDSFYEYLLKSWLMTTKHDVEARDMFYASVAAMDRHLVRRTGDGTVYLTDLKNGRPDNKMQHLVSCWASKASSHANKKYCTCVYVVHTFSFLRQFCLV